MLHFNHCVCITFARVHIYRVQVTYFAIVIVTFCSRTVHFLVSHSFVCTIHNVRIHTYKLCPLIALIEIWSTRLLVLFRTRYVPNTTQPMQRESTTTPTDSSAGPPCSTSAETVSYRILQSKRPWALAIHMPKKRGWALTRRSHSKRIYTLTIES